jgi:hypothetical protein
MPHWSQQETKYLTENLGKIPVEEIQQTLNRDYQSIRQKGMRQGIHHVKDRGRKYFWPIEAEMNFSVSELSYLRILNKRGE